MNFYQNSSNKLIRWRISTKKTVTDEETKELLFKTTKKPEFSHPKCVIYIL